MVFGKDIQADFIFDTAYVNLNASTLSVTHRDVWDYSMEIRNRIILNPHIFYKQDFGELLLQSKQAVASTINGDVENIAFTHGTTDSMNALLRSLVFLPGDEVLIDMHCYISYRRIIEFVCGRAGARMVNVYSPFPVWEKQDFIQSYIDAITPRTRLVVLEDISTSHGLQVPIEDIVDYCRSRGIQVLVSGANAFAVRKVDVKRLGANWYVGSCHKWGMSAQGVGFLWAKPENQSLRPTIISKYNHRAFPDNFDWAGTRDYTPWFTVAKGMQIVNAYKKAGSHAYCKDLLVWAKEYLCETFHVTDVVDDAMVGMMCVVMLPFTLQNRDISHQDIEDILLQDYKIITQISRIYDKKVLRLTASVFNTRQDFITLGDAVMDMAKRTADKAP